MLLIPRPKQGALTLAALGGEARVGKAQLMEAIGYRQLDRMLKANDPTRA